jgi:hypothetical protein
MPSARIFGHTRIKGENMRTLHLAGLSSLVVVPTLCSGAMGAAIDFYQSTPVDGPSDVQNNGNVVQAYDFPTNTGSTGTLTVNGVTFSNFNLNPSGDTTTINAADYSGFTSDPNPPGNDSQGFTGDFLTLMDNAAVRDGSYTNTLVLNGLTSGQSYQVEIITYDGRNIGGNFYVRTNTLTGDAGSTAGTDTYYGDPNAYYNNAGTYVLGTFTADSSSQTINFANSDTDSQINALIVSAVPEPASLGLIAISAVGLLKRRRR